VGRDRRLGCRSAAGPALARRHQEFETGADQLQAHWLAWLGALVLLLVAAGAWRSRAHLRNPAVVLTLVGAVGYGLVAGWHFWEHTRHQEAALTHLALVLTVLVMLGGAVTAALLLARTNWPTPL
jgi:hypothetical protein